MTVLTTPLRITDITPITIKTNLHPLRPSTVFPPIEVAKIPPTTDPSHERPIKAPKVVPRFDSCVVLPTIACDKGIMQDSDTPATKRVANKPAQELVQAMPSVATPHVKVPAAKRLFNENERVQWPHSGEATAMLKLWAIISVDNCSGP